MTAKFEWDTGKNLLNVLKHGVSFETAKRAFEDPAMVLARDEKHDVPGERRHFCFGRVDDAVLTVRYTVRRGVIRIFGAGYWRHGRRTYEKENPLHGRA